jgi:uncharacterized protein (DUF2141 family)
VALSLSAQQQVASGGPYKVTVIAEGVNEQDGNIGVLLFNSTKGWPEDRTAALRDVVVPAHAGVVKVELADVPAGTYAIAVAHDVNKNHKLDKNWIGMPTEQWGMSNNPHARIKAPAFSAAQFTVNHDMEIHVKMQ